MERLRDDRPGASGRSGEWMQPGDRRLLDSLYRDGPESCPLLSSRIGMHLKYARKRCEQLEACGFVRSRDERRYELTERGERYVDGDRVPSRSRE